MPRYFFHVLNGRDVHDDHGTQMPDDAAAKAEARVVACELVRDAGPKFWDNHEWHMKVVDETGRMVLTLSCQISSFEPTGSPG